MKKIIVLLVSILSIMQVRSQTCPTVTVTAPTADVEAGTSFQCMAVVSNLAKDASVTYNWVVSTGTITSGQGTSSITVEVPADDQYCTATVDMGGFPKTCSSSSSATVVIKKVPEKIITANTVTTAALNAAVKQFINKTNLKDLKISQTGLINIFAANAQQYAQIKTLIEKAFNANSILSFQYSIKNAGITNPAKVEMLLEKNAY